MRSNILKRKTSFAIFFIIQYNFDYTHPNIKKEKILSTLAAQAFAVRICSTSLNTSILIFFNIIMLTLPPLDRCSILNKVIPKKDILGIGNFLNNMAVWQMKNNPNSYSNIYIYIYENLILHYHNKYIYLHFLAKFILFYLHKTIFLRGIINTEKKNEEKIIKFLNKNKIS